MGSFSVSLLAKLGYEVIASSGRASDENWLINTLGAKRIMDRAELSQPGKPLGKERWAAAIDSVGSHTLSNVLAGTQRDGVVAACGMAQGAGSAHQRRAFYFTRRDVGGRGQRDVP